jgi:hypothetical protein
MRPTLRTIAGLWLALLARVAAAADWQPIVSPYNELFPALVIATANMPADPASPANGIYGDDHGLVGVSLTATRADQLARLTVRVPGFARASTLEARLPQAGRAYHLYPVIGWDFERLAGVGQPLPASVEFELALDGAPGVTRTARIRLRSVNDAPYFIRDGKASSDLNWMFAAYVNEDHPLVRTILTEALKSGLVDRFDGYQRGDPAQVYRQVYAIWHVLQRRGIRYSSITRTSSLNDKVLSQHVRFLDESWDNAQANCVDGSVLIASVLRKIGLNPFLVLVPGHMFLAFDLDAHGGDFGFLETTLLGEVKRNGKRKPSTLAGALDSDIDESASFASFEAAVEKGAGQYARAARHFTRDEPEYRLIDLEAARRMGVMPIAR